MALSRLAREFAAEIAAHDWSDAPYRADRAGHNAWWDTNSSQSRWLTEPEADTLRTNVMWVVGQVLLHADPNLDPFEFADACGVDTRTPSGRPRSGVITAGLRRAEGGGYDTPGSMAEYAPVWPDGETVCVMTENGRRLHSRDTCPGLRPAGTTPLVVRTTIAGAKVTGKILCQRCWPGADPRLGTPAS